MFIHGDGNGYRTFKYDVYIMNINYHILGYKKGTYVNNIIKCVDSVKENERNDDGYWYEKGDLAPKYTLHKYTSDLTLLSTYDVDTKTLTTEAIDISNKGRNKIKLTLTTSGTDYKTYISNDNSNWQEVTDITSGTPKELEVNGWNSLYIKIETNTSTINNIDVEYYKD